MKAIYFARSKLGERYCNIRIFPLSVQHAKECIEALVQGLSATHPGLVRVAEERGARGAEGEEGEEGEGGEGGAGEGGEAGAEAHHDEDRTPVGSLLVARRDHLFSLTLQMFHDNFFSRTNPCVFFPRNMFAENALFEPNCV